jgi:hypothetical protein
MGLYVWNEMWRSLAEQLENFSSDGSVHFILYHMVSAEGIAQSVQWLEYGLDDRGIGVRVQAGALELTQPPTYCEADHPSLSSAEVKNAWSQISISSWRGA